MFLWFFFAFFFPTHTFVNVGSYLDLELQGDEFDVTFTYGAGCHRRTCHHRASQPVVVRDISIWV